MPLMTRERTGQLLRFTLKVITDAGGSLPIREVYKALSEQMDFTEEELELSKGLHPGIRWRQYLGFQTIGKTS